MKRQSQARDKSQMLQRMACRSKETRVELTDRIHEECQSDERNEASVLRRVAADRHVGIQVTLSIVQLLAVHHAQHDSTDS